MWKLLHISFLFSLYFNKNVFSIRVEIFEPEVAPKLLHPNPIQAYSNSPIEVKNKKRESNDQEGATHNKKILSQPLQFSYNKQHEDVKSKPKNEKHKSGGGKSHFSDHKSSHGKKGEKGHKESHDEEHSEKGHHDKEGHKGSYKDHGGKKKKQYDEHDHEQEGHKSEKGSKQSKFAESGEHKKGHSTKGEHNINKKNHYEKKHEFFDEYYEDGDSEKHGAHHSSKDYHKGGSKKGGHDNSAHHEDHYGKKGHHEKGKHYSEDTGHKKAGGHDEHHKHDEKYGKKGDKKSGKKWGFSHGKGGKKQKLTDDSHRSSSKNDLKKKQFVPTIEYLKNIPSSVVEHVDDNKDKSGESTDEKTEFQKNKDFLNNEAEHYTKNLESDKDNQKLTADESDYRKKLVEENENLKQQEKEDADEKIQDKEDNEFVNSEEYFPKPIGYIQKSEDELPADDGDKSVSPSFLHTKEIVPITFKTAPKLVNERTEREDEKEEDNTESDEKVQYEENNEGDVPTRNRYFQKREEEPTTNYSRNKKKFVPKSFKTAPKHVNRRIEHVEKEEEREDNTESDEKIQYKENKEFRNREEDFPKPTRYFQRGEDEPTNDSDKSGSSSDMHKKKLVPNKFKTVPKHVNRRIELIEKEEEGDDNTEGGEKIQFKENLDFRNHEGDFPERNIYFKRREDIPTNDSDKSGSPSDLHKKKFVPKSFTTAPKYVNRRIEHIEKGEDNTEDDEKIQYKENQDFRNREEGFPKPNRYFQKSDYNVSADDGHKSSTQNNYHKKKIVVPKQHLENSRDSLSKFPKKFWKPQKNKLKKIQENKKNEALDSLAVIIKSPIPTYSEARNVRKVNNNLLLIPKDRMYINKVLFKQLEDQT